MIKSFFRWTFHIYQKHIFSTSCGQKENNVLCFIHDTRDSTTILLENHITNCQVYRKKHTQTIHFVKTVAEEQLFHL